MSAAKTSAGTLKSQVESWKKSTKVDHKSFVLIDADEKTHSLLFTLDEKLVKASLPKTAESAWMIESEEKDLLEFITTLSSWAIDKGATLSLDAFLDKCLTVLTNKKQKKEKAANADDAWGDDEDAHADAEADGGGGGDGWGDGGDDQWEDGEHASGNKVTHEDEFAKWHALKKKWTAKEEQLRKKMATSGLAMVDESKAAKQIFSSKAASKIITNTLIELMKTGAKTGVDVAPVDDNIFQWRLRLSEFPVDSALYRDLKKLKAQYGTDYVEINISFPMDLYPFYPPSVRLVRPRLANFLMGRIVCAEELSLAKWSPVREITDVLGSIRRLLTTYGAVDDNPTGVNDPKNALPPYTALEFQLLRLSMLTEIPPRVIKTMSDSEKKDFVVPKSKPKQVASAATPATAAAPAVDDYDDGYGYGGYGGGSAGATVKKAAWAKGTGYGHGAQSDWDPEAWSAAQKKKDAEIMEIVAEMLHEFEAKTVPAGLISVLEQSCLVPFLENYLKNDSITDMERHSSIYQMVFAVCQNIAKHPSLSRLFLLLPFEKKALSAYAKELGAQAAIVEKFAKGGSSSSSSAAGAAVGLSMTQRIVAMAAAVEKATKAAEAEQKFAEATAAALASSSSSAASGTAAPVNATSTVAAASAKDSKSVAGKVDSKADAARAEAIKFENEYIAALSPFRFDMEVEKFGHHHYWGTDTGSLTTKYRRHLSTEYADLSKSLPINADSSVWMRVHESKMSHAQMIISAPSETPYAGGCFLFDIHFPGTYPAGPPSVNLQTTGGGSHRFNPNLYNTGKVCLSLLGTWQGQKGESWNEKTSTFLQVAVSIQSLIFVPLPYFNEPGYERSMGTAQGTAASDAYNADQQQATVKFAMIDMLKNPPLNFEDVIRNHFYLQRTKILATCEKWAATNSRVATQLPTLRAELAKLKAPAKPKDSA